MALKHPDVYDEVIKHTRMVFESNRPKAVLLEGPPGTGKTLTARILASQCDLPLIVLKLESVVSKWFGESETRLSNIIDACDRIEGGAILFIDEIDALAISRDSPSSSQDVTRRILSVLLTRLEGFQEKSKSIVLCTTNRKQDLDSALLSRFDLDICYELPDEKTRKEILKRYAKQFLHTKEEDDFYSTLAELSAGMSCRDIKEFCQHAERTAAARYIKSTIQAPPPAKESSSSSFFFGLNSGSSSSSSGKSTAPAKEGGSMVPTMEDYVEAARQRARLSGEALPTIVPGTPSEGQSI